MRPSYWGQLTAGLPSVCSVAPIIIGGHEAVSVTAQQASAGDPIFGSAPHFTIEKEGSPTSNHATSPLNQEVRSSPGRQNPRSEAPRWINMIAVRHFPLKAWAKLPEGTG